MGRREELDLVRGFMPRGETRGVFLAGAPGTGKTRLAMEAASIAEVEGLEVAYAPATAASSDIPFGALVSLLPRPNPTASMTGRLEEGLDAMRSRAGAGRLVLVVDDAHLLDESSTLLLQRAVLAGVVFLIATIRTGEPVPEWVIALWKDLHADRIEVQPLSHAETAQLLREALAGEVDGGMIQTIWTATQGNPLYVRELVIEAVAAGGLRQVGSVWTLDGPLSTPQSLSELIDLRMRPLSEGAKAALEVMALAETLGLEDLRALTTDTAIDELESHGIVEVVVDTQRRKVRLVHPIYGEVVRSSMPYFRRANTAGRLADQLEASGTRRRGDLLRLATWRLIGGRFDSDVFPVAALEAYRGGDFNLAERFCRAVLEVGDDAEARLLLGQILHEGGKHSEAEEAWEGLAGATLNEGQRQRLAVQRAVNLFFGLGRGEAALSVLTAEADSTGASATVASLIANQAWLQLNMGQIDEARATLSGMGAEGDPALRLVRAVSRAWIEALGGDYAETQSAVVEAERLRGEVPMVLPGRFRDFPELPRTIALLESGDLEQAEAGLTAGYTAAVNRHPVFIQAWWLFLLGRLRLEQGRMTQAAASFRQGAALQRKMNQPGLLRWHLGGLALTRVQSAGGRLEAKELIAECTEIGVRAEYMFAPLVVAARAWLMALDGRRMEAVELLLGEAERLKDAGFLTLEGRLLHHTVRLGGVTETGSRLKELAGEGRMAKARFLHSNGLAERNVGFLEEAATEFEAMGAHLLAAEVWNAAAVEHARTGGRRRATSSRRRAHDLVRLCQEAETPGIVSAEEIVPLTAREREVVVLAAGGMASKDIAERLYVSVRTVNNLLQRAYTKLGVSSRREAADALGLRQQ